MTKLECFVGAGCVMCNGSGYKGRTGVFEILTFSPAIRELVSVDAPEPEIRREALAEGMQTLLMATLNKVRAGKTTLAELFRVIELDEVDRGSADECPSCGTVTEPDFLACPACACRLAPACPACDRKVLEHWKACPYCCTRLDQPTRKPRPEAQAAPVAVSASAGARTAKAPRKVGGPTLAASR